MISLAIYFTILGIGLIVKFNKHQDDAMDRLLLSLGLALVVFSFLVSHIWWFTLLGIYK